MLHQQKCRVKANTSAENSISNLLLQLIVIII